MEELYLTDEEVAADHAELLESQAALDARVVAGEKRKKALGKVLAKTLDPNGGHETAVAMAASMKRGIIEARLSEVDHPVDQAEAHRGVLDDFTRIYGAQIKPPANQEASSDS